LPGADASASITNQRITFTTGGTGSTGGAGSNYTFVPTASAVIGFTATIGAQTTTQATFSVEVISDITKPNLGKIRSIAINNPGNYASGIGAPGLDFISARVAGATFTTVGTSGQVNFGSYDPTASISLQITPDNSNKLSATAFPFGTGINNYIQNNNATQLIPTGAAFGTNKLGAGLTFVTTDAFKNSVYAFTSAGNNLGNDTRPAAWGKLSSSATDPFVSAMIVSNPYLVAFEKPEAAGSQIYAWGFPTYDAAGGLLGVRIVNAGVGYSSANGTIDMYIIPNVFRGSNAKAWPTNNNLMGEVTHIGTVTIPTTAGTGSPTTTAASSTYTVARGRTNASVRFVIANSGKGYYGVPEFVIIGGGMPLRNAYQIGANKTSGGIVYVENGMVRSISDLVYDLDYDPKYLTATAGETANITLEVKVIDRLSAAITGAFNDPAKVNGRVYTNKLGGISAIDIGQYNNSSQALSRRNAGIPDAGVADRWTNFPNRTAVVNINGTGVAGGGTANNNNTNQNVTSGVGFATVTAGTDAFYNFPPRVVISAPLIAGGTQATATSELYLLNNQGGKAGDGGNMGTHFGKINNIVVTNGGSGYSQGNWAHGSDKNGNTYASAAEAAQGFRIIGGNEGGANASNGQGSVGDGNTTVGAGGAFNMENTQGEDNVHFDVFTGITYVRDVHYGTGKEVE